MRGSMLLAIMFLLAACAPAARTVEPTAAPIPAGGLSTTPAPDGGPSPAEAATFTAVAILVQATPTPVGTARPAAPQTPTTVRPTVPASITSAKIGDAVKAPNWEFTVQSAQRAKEFVYFTRPEMKATAKGEFVMVLLRVKNVGNQNFGLNAPLDFELHDAQNRKYAPESFGSESGYYFGEWLKLQNRQPLCIQCPPDVPIETGVLFDVAPGLTGLKLRIVQAKTDVALP